MTERHDKNRDGLDFMEMYTASGGRLQDLWFIYSNILTTPVMNPNKSKMLLEILSHFC